MATTSDFTDLIDSSTAKKPWRDRRILAHLHVAHRLEYDEMAGILDCNEYTVGKWVRELEVQFPWRVECVLRTLYNVHGHSSIAMAKMWGTGKATVLKWMCKFGVERSGIGERVDYPELHDESWLREKYIDEYLSSHKIADLLGCDKKAVIIGLRRNGIEVRESQSDYSGRLNSKYSGGANFIRSIRHALSGRQIEWRKQAKRICEEYGECYSCGDVETLLHAHHIIPVASGGVNEDELLIPLCQSCHTKADKFTEKYTTRHLVEPIVKSV